MKHYSSCHAASEYKRGEVMFMDEICESGFANRNLLQGHLWGGVRLRGFRSRGCAHIKESIKAFGPDGSITYV